MERRGRMRRLLVLAPLMLLALELIGAGPAAADTSLTTGRVEADPSGSIDVSVGRTVTSDGEGAGLAAGRGPVEIGNENVCRAPLSAGGGPCPVEPSPGGGPAVDPVVLAQEARARLAIPAPEIRLNPSTRQDQLVQVATWMWVDSSTWGSRSATAAVPGVAVTATAAAQRVVWDMGNGDRVTCTGPGTPYDTSRGEAEQRSDCSYTYRHAGYFTVTATVEWAAAWSGPGAGGSLPTLTRSASVPVRVVEGQAINTG